MTPRWAAALLCLAACTTQDAPATTKDESATATMAQVDKAATSSAPAKTKEPAKPDDGVQVIQAKTKEGGTAELALKPPPGWKFVQPPSSPDPHAGKFPLSEALKGVKGKGKLVARIATTLGDFHCDLYDDKAPNTVANFVGLARGLRKVWDENAREWVKRRYYDGTTFHRVIPGFMIQGGDFKGDGSGRLWFTIPDELHPSLSHDRGGQLCMANRGPNTNEAQFFLTERAAPHLDGSYSIFGQCEPTELVYRIARVPQGPGNKPLTPVVISRVDVMRSATGAAEARWETDPTEGLPRNTVPGVAPPGRAVEVTR
jgi:peptidyl-prolyl cis-trans isomerase A (cyclophilin A)